MRVQRTETIESLQVVADADGLTSRQGLCCWSASPTGSG